VYFTDPPFGPIHNIAWRRNGRTLYLCASDRLYRIQLARRGNPPMSTMTLGRDALHGCPAPSASVGDQRIGGFASSS